jgi:WD40 repeat protein
MAKVPSDNEVRHVLSLLQKSHFYQSLITLEQESGVRLRTYGKELDFFYDLVCQGRFADAEKFLEPLKKRSAAAYNQLFFSLRQQKFLETIENDANPDVNELSFQLQAIEGVASKQQVMTLCAVLQLNHISEHHEFHGWSVWKGRAQCFDNCLKSLKEIYEINVIAPDAEAELVANRDISFDFKENTSESDFKEAALPLISKPPSKDLSSKRWAAISESSTKGAELQAKLGLEKSVTGVESEGSDRGHSSAKKTVSWSTHREQVKVVPPPAVSEFEDEKRVYIETLDLEEAFEQTSYQDDEIELVKPTPRATQELMSNFTPTALREVARVADVQPIRAATFNASGDYFVLGTNSKSVKICSSQNIVDGLLYNEQQGRPQGIDVIFEVKSAHYGSVYCVDWARNRNLIASGSNDKTIRVIHCPDLLALQESQSETVVYSNGTYLNGEGDLPPLQEILLTGSQGTVRTVCFHPLDDSVLLSGGMVDPDIKVWNTETGKCVQSLKGSDGAVFRLAAAGDASYFCSVGSDRKVRLWDIRTSRCVQALNSSSFVEMSHVSLNHSSVQTRAETKSRITQLYSARSAHRPSTSTSAQKLAAVAHCDGVITLWDLNMNRLFRKINVHSADCRSVEFSSDTRWLVSASFDTTLGLVDVGDMHRGQYKLEQHADRVVSATWHPYLPIVLSTSADKTARLFSTASSPVM